MRRLLVALALCLWAMPALATVTANSVVTAQTSQAPKVQILPGSLTVTLTSTTNFVTLYTGAANGSLVSSIICTSNDTASHNIVLGEEKAGALTTLLPISVTAIGSASATTVTNTGTNMLSGTAIPGLAQDSDGNPVFPLNANDVLVVGVLTTAVTASDAISCFAKAADF